jgi:hypothetical protein
MTALTDDLSLPEWRQIDLVCDLFEAEWQRQSVPCIEDFLGRVEERLRPVLLPELVRLELEWRLERGQTPLPEEYAGRYPGVADSLPGQLAAAEVAVTARRLAAQTEPWNTPAPSTDPHSQQAANTYVADTSPPSVQDPVRRVGEYDLLGLLGEGGMGQVWKARHRRLGKLVALKLLHPDREHSHDAVQRFVREMKAIGTLDHPNVVEASDAGESDGVVYLAMRLIDGEDLARYVRQRGPLPIAEACELARQVAVGLDYLHGEGLVHRDLKPGNLMRTTRGEVKILDLGLARWQRRELAPSTEGPTRTGDGMGTPDYMAPEQITGAAAVDIRADLYALGCTLFFLLTGKAPFDHIPGRYQKMKAHESTPAPDVRAPRPEVPGELAELIARLLAKVPVDRPQAPREVAEALAFWAARPASAFPVAPKPRRPRRWWLGLAGGAVAATLLAGILAMTLFRGPGSGGDQSPGPGPGPAPRPPEVMRFDVAHLSRDGEVSRELGMLGVGSFSTYRGDRATVSVRLSRPAYGYLLAYAADGKEYLLDPPEETRPPGLSDRLQYPPAGKQVEYELDDWVGLHVFLAAVSGEPLPAYAEWKRQHGTASWKGGPVRVGTVWRQVGGDLYAATAADPDVRSPGAVKLGVAPVLGLSEWWRARPGVAQVGLTGFTVQKAK